jgi:non-homologous end joining protein Ku
MSRQIWAGAISLGSVRILVQMFLALKGRTIRRPSTPGPGVGGHRPYRLLYEAMERSRKVGIARFVPRTKQSLAARTTPVPSLREGGSAG